jgi:hypothetical protein
MTISNPRPAENTTKQLSAEKKSETRDHRQTAKRFSEMMIEIKDRSSIAPSPCAGTKRCSLFPRMNRCMFLLSAVVLSSIVLVQADTDDSTITMTPNDPLRGSGSGSSPVRTYQSGASPLHPRRLEIGDFSSFNEVFSDSTIAIPDASFSPRVAGFTLDLDLTAGVCKDVTIGDVTIEWSIRNNQEIVATVKLLELDIVCSLDYKYGYILGVNGRGVVDVFTRNNTASAVLVFGSQDFDKLPPDQFAVEDCKPAINVFDLDFDGEGRLSLGSALLNAIEKPLRETVANSIEDFLCEFFQEADDDIAKSLTRITELIEPYLIELEEVDPLALENALEVPANVNLLDFQQPNGTFASVIDIMVEEVGYYLGKKVDDGNGGLDLNLNILLRRFFLDSDGALNVDLTSIAGLGDGYLFEGSNLLGEISIRIVNVEVTGLDTFTRFDDLQELGRQTLQTTFAIESLSLVIAAEVEVRPPGGLERQETTGGSTN